MIKVCIIGVGNCTSSLYQGIHYYSVNNVENEGIMSIDIGI